MSTQVRERARLDLKSLRAPTVVRTFRPGEIAAAGLAVGFVVLIVLYYVLYLAPVQNRLTQVEKEAADQVTLLGAQATPAQRGPSQKEQIQQAKDSLGDFESGRLKPMAQGRIDLINEINQLARADNLHLGAGIEMHAIYGVLDPSDIGSQGSKKKKDADTLDVFPRVQFHFVVRGEYKDLRKFLRDLESSKQYVVVDALNLSSGEQKQGRGGKGAQALPGGGLSLTVSMNAYFRP